MGKRSKIVTDLPEDAGKMDFAALGKIVANINRTAVTQKRWQVEVRSKLDAKLKNLEESVTKKKASKIQLSWCRKFGKKFMG